VEKLFVDKCLKKESGIELNRNIQEAHVKGRDCNLMNIASTNR